MGSILLTELRALADRHKPAIALLYGRRRVGKTHLLEHAWADRRVFYFVAADASPEIN
jgi:AAA+ ATPase superfamily predicted ATPase